MSIAKNMKVLLMQSFIQVSPAEPNDKAKQLSASKLSYLGEWSESRENARASGEAGSRGGEEKPRPYARAFSRGSLRLRKQESLLAG